MFQTWITFKMLPEVQHLRQGNQVLHFVTSSASSILIQCIGNLGLSGLQYVACSFGSDEIHVLLRGLVVST